MKNYYFIIAFAIVSVPFYGQIVNIPDVNFKNKLVTTNCAHLTSPFWLTDVDTNNDGEIQLIEAQNVLELDVSTNQFNSNGDILSMEGIAAFTNLTKLNCSGNTFSSLNATMLGFLVELNCDHSHLTSLEVSSLTHLEILNCNFNSLTSLNLSGLSHLTSFNCVYNSLTSLDVSDSPLLVNFQCDTNQLNTLVLGSQQSLKTLRCNNNPLTTIDPQLFPNIEDLNCSFTSISSINLNGLNSLATLEIESTLVSEIDCSQTGLWYHLYCSYNPNLTYINVRNSRVPFSDPDLLDFPFRMENLPNLVTICMDDGEQNLLPVTNFNSSGNVSLFTGPNCDIPLFITPNAVAGFEGATAFKIYPNPVNTIVQLEVATGVAVQSVQIFTTLGQLVRSIPVLNPSSKSSFEVSDLKAGTYFITLFSNQGKSTKKFIKM